MYPITPAGMFIAILAMFIGLFVIALPVIIVGGYFEQVFSPHIFFYKTFITFFNFRMRTHMFWIFFCSVIIAWTYFLFIMLLYGKDYQRGGESGLLS